MQSGDRQCVLAADLLRHLKEIGPFFFRPRCHMSLDERSMHVVCDRLVEGFEKQPLVDYRRSYRLHLLDGLLFSKGYEL